MRRRRDCVRAQRLRGLDDHRIHLRAGRHNLEVHRGFDTFRDPLQERLQPRRERAFASASVSCAFITTTSSTVTFVFPGTSTFASPPKILRESGEPSEVMTMWQGLLPSRAACDPARVSTGRSALEMTPAATLPSAWRMAPVLREETATIAAACWSAARWMASAIPPPLALGDDHGPLEPFPGERLLQVDRPVGLHLRDSAPVSASLRGWRPLVGRARARRRFRCNERPGEWLAWGRIASEPREPSVQTRIFMSLIVHIGWSAAMSDSTGAAAATAKNARLSRPF